MSQDTLLSSDSVKDALLTKVNNDIGELFTSVAALAGESGVLVSSNDSTVGYLNGKLVAGDNAVLTENNDGGNETLTVNAKSNAEAKTANYTVTAAELNGLKTFTNAGASGTINFTLPVGAAGYRGRFIVIASQTLRITTNTAAVKFRSVGEGLSANNYMDFSTVGQVVEIEYDATDGHWELVHYDAARTATWTEINQLDGVTVGGSSSGDIADIDTVQTLTNKTIDADNNTISNLEHGSEVDNLSSGIHGVTGSVVGTTDSQTLTNKTLTSPVLNTGVSGTAVLDEDDMASDSATKLVTQQSAKAYIDNILMYSGILHRPVFSNGASAYTVAMDAGAYLVGDKIAQWTSSVITTAISSPVASTGYYLYLDYSAITSGVAITNSELYWSTTAPTWTAGPPSGWYNGDDLCIFGERTDGIPIDLYPFWHAGADYIQRGYNLSSTINSSSFTDIDISGYVPAFVREASISFRTAGMSGGHSGSFMWRPNGSSGSGLWVGQGELAYGANYDKVYTVNNVRVLLDSSGIFEAKTTDSAIECSAVVHGWYFPRGM